MQMPSGLPTLRALSEKCEWNRGFLIASRAKPAREAFFSSRVRVKQLPGKDECYVSLQLRYP